MTAPHTCGAQHSGPWLKGQGHSVVLNSTSETYIAYINWSLCKYNMLAVNTSTTVKALPEFQIPRQFPTYRQYMLKIENLYVPGIVCICNC